MGFGLLPCEVSCILEIVVLASTLTVLLGRLKVGNTLSQGSRCLGLYQLDSQLNFLGGSGIDVLLIRVAIERRMMPIKQQIKQLSTLCILSVLMQRLSTTGFCGEVAGV